MEKRTILILTIISAIFSTVYIILSYYGLTRYCSMSLFSTEGYAKKYPSLDHDSSRVVITVQTNQPSKIKPVINSLLDQTMRGDRIIVITKNDIETPSFLKKINFIKVYKIGKEYPDDKEYLPALMIEKESDSKIICVNDDIVYGKDFIQEIIDASNKHPKKVIFTNNAFLVKPKFFTTEFYDSKDNLSSYIKKTGIDSVNVKYRENYKKMF